MKHFITLIAPFAFAISAQAKIKVLATINGEKITSEQFAEKYLEVQATSSNPPSKKKFLEDLVRFRLGVQAAKKAEVSKDPRFQKLIEQNMFKFWLDAALSKELKKIKITKNDMENFYAKYPDIHLKSIFIFVSPEASPRDIQKAKKRVKHIISGLQTRARSFDEFALLYSDDSSSKKKGGDLGPRSFNTFHPAVYNKAIVLKPGQFASEAVRTHQGFYIIRLEKKVSYDQADKGIIRLNVFEEKEANIVNTFFKDLKAKNKISYKNF